MIIIIITIIQITNNHNNNTQITNNHNNNTDN